MYAIYFEFKRENDVHQCIFIPSTLLGTATLPPTYGYKELTPNANRRAWNLVPNHAYTADNIQPADLKGLLGKELTQFGGIHPYMTSVISDPAWSTVGAFPVEVQTSDLLALKEKPNRMPTTLNTRIKHMRAEQGFPALPGGIS